MDFSMSSSSFSCGFLKRCSGIWTFLGSFSFFTSPSQLWFFRSIFVENAMPHFGHVNE